MVATWVDLGLIGYTQAYTLQTRLVDYCRTQPNLLFFLVLEHKPVFTLGRRGGRDHLGVSEAFLADNGVELFHIERGGDITYHGPGQIIVYPIFNLRKQKISVREYVLLLEESMLKTALDFNVSGNRDPRNHGIWVGDKKLGSIGIAIRHGTCFHGLGLNVNTDLTPFDWVNPCGLTGITMTSFAEEKKKIFGLGEVKESLRQHLSSLFSMELTPTSPATLPTELVELTGLEHD